MKKGKSARNKSLPGAPYGGRWLDGVFYAFVEPDAGLTDAEVRGFEKWMREQAKTKGKWTEKG